MSATSPGFTRHDHAQCVRTAIAAAEKKCAARKAQMTPVRRRTLEILLESHAAMGAYDVLARLDADGFGSKPPVAYRALGFLVDQGFAHRIERLNAFVACAFPGDRHDPAFMICRGCGAVVEALAEAQPVAGGQTFGQTAAAAGFKVEQTVIEAQGLCPACQTGKDPQS